MRPINDERMFVQYVRFNRVVDLTLFDSLGPFIDDIRDALRSVGRLTGAWKDHVWFLGNLGEQYADDGRLVGLSAQFGYSEEVTSSAPPEYDENALSWGDESPLIPTGVVAVFALDGASQIAAVTTRSGDLSMPAFCHAMGDLLNKIEMSQSLNQTGLRAARTWEVDIITQRGSFDLWANTMAKVTKIRANFHLPNPKVLPDIEPVVEFLNSISGEKGSIAASSENGINIAGNPVMQAAVKMQEHDYGNIKATGVKTDDTQDVFKSANHAVEDKLAISPTVERMTGKEIIALLLVQLALRIKNGLRK